MRESAEINVAQNNRALPGQRSIGPARHSKEISHLITKVTLVSRVTSEKEHLQINSTFNTDPNKAFVSGKEMVKRVHIRHLEILLPKSVDRDAQISESEVTM